jgi:hypothetical protein
MNQSFLSAQTLLRCQFLTRDGSGAGITDLILDALSWRVRFLAIEAVQGGPHQDLLVTPWLVAEVDEARRTVVLDLIAADLEAAPPLAFGEGVVGLENAGVIVPPDWRSRFEPDAGIDAHPAPAGGDVMAADPAAGADFDPEQLQAAQLTRLTGLRRMRAETADGTELRIQDLLIDENDWPVAYLDLLLPADRGARGGGEAKPLRCLLARTGIDWLDPYEQTLHLAVFIQEIRDAPTWPLAVAGRADARVRTLVPASWRG